MNRNYKVIWNSSLNCFMAVAEYAKSRGKSSSGAVTSGTKASSGSVVASGANILRLSALYTGLIAASFSMPSMAGAVDGGSVYLNCQPSNVIGSGSTANQSVAVGAFACAPGDQSVAVGANTHAKGNSSVAIGGDDLDRVANGTSGTVATGTTNEAFNTTATAKQFKTLTGQYLVNVQGGKQYISTVAGDSSVAVGVMSSANASLSLAFGTRSEANVNSATALGTGATASKAGAIALGAGSLTDGTATKIEQSTVNGVDFVGFKGTNAFAGTALDAGRQVSVGSIGNERQIKNVAPGELSATSTDAINGSQIYAVSSKLIDNINAVKTTTDAVVAGTAGLVKQANGTAPITVGAQTGGTSVSFANSANVDRQLKGVAAGTNTNDAVNVGQLNTTNTNVSTAQNTANAAQTTANTANTAANSALAKANLGIKVGNGTTNNQFALGSTINVKGDNNLTTTTTSDGVQVSLNKTLNLGATGSVTTGNSKLDNTGLIITNGPSVTATGINAGDKKITSVLAGESATDAVNVGQLTNLQTVGNNKINQLGGSIATNLGGDSVYDPVTGTVTAPKYTLNRGNNTTDTTDYDNVGDALGNLDTRTTTNTGNIATNTTNIAGLTNGTLGLVQQADNTSAITVGGASAGDSVNFTGTAGDRKLTGIAKGTDATDAVNFSQLAETELTTSIVAGNNTRVSSTTTGNNTEYTVNAEKSTVSTAAGSGLDVAAGTTTNDITDYAVSLNAATKASLSKADSAVQTISSKNSNVTVSRVDNGVELGFVEAPTFAGKVKANGFDSNNQKIVNVANGATTADSKDAINGGQLNTAAGSIATNLGGDSVYDPVTGTVTAPKYTLNRGNNTTDTTDYDNVGDALGNLDTRTTTNTGNIATNTTNITKAKTTVTAGDNVVVTPGENSDGSVNYVVKTKDDLVLTSVTAGSTKLSNIGITITKTLNSPESITDVTLSNSGLNNGNNKITNVAAGTDITDVVNVGQLEAVSTVANNSVQYDRNADGSVNYDRIIAGNGKGSTTVIKKNTDGKYVVVSGGTVITNVANGVNADDAINKGQLDSIVANNITDVEIKDQSGNVIKTENVTQNVINTKVSTNYEDNKDSLFLTYNKEGQEVTDRLTIGETVQKMNTEGVKFAHTNAGPQSKGDITSGVTNDSSAGGFDSTAIGVNAIIEAGANSTVALGHDTKASANATNSVVIGKDSQVAGESSIAIGNNAQALGNKSISIGTGNTVTGNNSGAFGDPSTVIGDSSYSVGNNNTIDSADTFVIGSDVKVNQKGAVVLGVGSLSTTGAEIIGFGSVGKDAIYNTRSTTGAVAVGNANVGVYRQITGVAAGTADSDAVNVSQLKAVNAKIDNIGGSNTTLNDAAVQYDKKDGNIDKGSITLAGTSVSTGIGNNGNTVVTSGGTTITNVANGVKVSDAVNKGQLDSLGGGVAGIIGGSVKYENGQLVVDSSGIGNTGEVTIHDAIASINNGNAQANESIKANTNDIKANAESIKTNANNIKANTDSIKINTDGIKANANRLDAGLSFGADSGNNINKSVGDSTAVKFEGGNNITTTATGSGIKFDLNGDISVDSVTTGNTTINNTGVTIKDGASMTVDGIYAGDKTITGVADGIEVKDAVNFGQLNALDKRLGNSINELGYKINEVEDDANAGISAAMAMSSLPQAYIPGKSMVGGGIATYNGQSAVAVGVSKVSDNGRWVIKANGTADTQGNAGGAIGAGFHF